MCNFYWRSIEWWPKLILTKTSLYDCQSRENFESSQNILINLYSFLFIPRAKLRSISIYHGSKLKLCCNISFIKLLKFNFVGFTLIYMQVSRGSTIVTHLSKNI